MRKLTQSKIEKFKAYLKNEERSSATIERYTRDLERFRRWLEDNENGGKNAVTKGGVLNYKANLLEKYAVTSANSIISSINSFFDAEGWQELKIKTVKQQRRIFASQEYELTKSEYVRLLAIARDAGNIRLFLLMQTLCCSGIRISELKFITVESLGHGRAEIRCKGKLRIVFLPRELCVMLSDYCRSREILHGPIFISKNGACLDRTNVWSDMKRLAKTAGIDPKKVFPHNLRHLFARTFYASEKDIVRLADLLGHSSVNTTRIYTMESAESCRKHLEKLNLVIF